MLLCSATESHGESTVATTGPPPEADAEAPVVSERPGDAELVTDLAQSL